MVLCGQLEVSGETGAGSALVVTGGIFPTFLVRVLGTGWSLKLVSLAGLKNGPWWSSCFFPADFSFLLSQFAEQLMFWVDLMMHLLPSAAP